MADTEIGEETPSDDLRSMIAAAAEVAETPIVEKVAAEPKEPKAAKEPAEASGERARGPDGKFLPKEGEAEDAAVKAPKEPKEAAKDPAAKAEVTSPETPEVKKPDAAAPDPTARWSATDKATFKALPPSAQEFITRRYGEMEGDYTKKTQAIADFKRTYEPVDQMFAPFKAQMKAQGWTEASLIKSWADVEKDFMEGRGAKRVLDIIKTYRLPVEEIAAGLGIKAGAAAAPPPGATGTEPQLDPTVVPLLEKQFGVYAKPLMDQLQALTNEREQQKATQVRLDQIRKDDEARTANEKVQNFVNEKSADGSPLRPYFNDVSSHMVALAKAERDAGRTPDLQAIYDQAVWAHPPTREKLLEAQRVSQEEKSRQESLAKAAQAKKASASVRGAPGSGHAPASGQSAKAKSLRDIIAEAADASAEA